MIRGVHLGNPGDTEAQRRLGNILARHLAGADLLGRLQVLRHARKKTGKMLPISPSSRVARFAEDDNANPTAGFSFDMPNVDAERFVQQLTPVTRAVFNGLTAQYRRDAFTLAGTTDVRLIEKVRDALGAIAKNGGTIDQFRSEARRLATASGVEDLNAATLDNSFQIYMQKAYSSGRLEQMEEPHMIEALPFWQYWTVGDAHVRPGHAELDGFIARAIDPVWRKIYPPWDFGCRCSTVNMPEDEALKIDPSASEGGIERLAMRPLVLLELAQTDFRNLKSL